jgi:hypothetical protein
MYCLSNDQIDFIAEDICRRGIHIAGLQENLLDHICILMEQKLEAEEDFGMVYSTVIRSFYKNELKEIQDETIFLLKYGHHRVVSRPLFFLFLFILFIGPFIAYDIAWLINAYPQSGFHLPMYIWGATFVYSLFPLLTLMVLMFTPERLDPVIPRKSKILLGFRPFIKVVPASSPV